MSRPGGPAHQDETTAVPAEWISMQITINGNPRQIGESCTLLQLLEQLQLAGKRIAVELNEAIVPRARHGETVLHDGDRIEIIHAIGGG
jgi:sulfur carrier protein